MTAHRNRRLSAISLVSIAVGFSIASPARASAQSAWIPVDGEVSVSLTFQNLNFNGHFNEHGVKNAGGIPSRAYLGIFQIEYALTDRLAVTARLPYIASRFTGDHDHPAITRVRNRYEEFSRTNPEAAGSSLDTGEFYATFQDFNSTLRYNLLDKGLLITPMIGVTIPSHHYRTIGEAAPGQDLRALHTGINVGRLLDPLLPQGYVHVRYTYSFVQRLLGIKLDRSSADFEVGYSVTPIVSVRGLASWSHTHGGLPYSRTEQDPFLFFAHDRLLASRSWHVGGGTTISLTDSMDLDAAIVSLLSGASTHYGAGITIGLTWHFLPAPDAQPSARQR